jgi:hypothetical protein
MTGPSLKKRAAYMGWMKMKKLRPCGAVDQEAAHGVLCRGDSSADASIGHACLNANGDYF